MAYNGYIYSKITNKVKLTRRQVEACYWLAHGQTEAEIARSMKCSGWTARKHLWKARNNLGSDGRIPQVLLAAYHGFIDLEGIQQALEEHAKYIRNENLGWYYQED